MKKGFAVCLALTLLLTLTACGNKKAEQESPNPPPVTQEPAVEVPVELLPVEDVEVAADGMEGRLPGGDYDLPEEVVPMIDWQWSGAVALLAQEGDVAFYAVEGKESSPALLRWGDSQAEFDWCYSTPQAIEPELWVYDIDGDGETEVAVDCYGGSGTGVSMEYLYVVEKEADGTLVSYELPWQAIAKALNEQLQTVLLAEGTYAALGRELVDISADLENVEAENVKVALGQVVSYRPLENGLACRFGVVAEGKGIPSLSLYVAEVEGEAHYENGIFTLENLHLLSNK